MKTPGATQAATLTPADAAAIAQTRRVPTWLLMGLTALAAAALWLVAFDNGQASAMVDGTGTAMHELFHDGRHLLGAPCH